MSYVEHKCSHSITHFMETKFFYTVNLEIHYIYFATGGTSMVRSLRGNAQQGWIYPYIKSASRRPSTDLGVYTWPLTSLEWHHPHSPLRQCAGAAIPFASRVRSKDVSAGAVMVCSVPAMQRLL